MSLIATAKNKAAKGSVAAAFKNEAGAIDLASIMVGIIVIGLIGGVIAATVFAVIPWAQDNAAKQQLDSVASAQSAFVGLSSDPTQNAGGTANSVIKFGSLNDLSGASLLPSTTKVKIATQGTGVDAHYLSAVKSASGKIFYITDNKTQPTDAGTSGAAFDALKGANTGLGTLSANGVVWGASATPGPAASYTFSGSF